VEEPSVHQAVVEPNVYQAVEEPSVRQATGECNSRTNNYQLCCVKTDTSEHADDDSTQSVCRVPPSATNNSVVMLRDSMVQSTTSDVADNVSEEAVCSVDR